MLGWFEWCGCLLGILGAVLVAVKSVHAHWAWVMWLVSNISWTIYGLATDNMALAIQQSAFTVTSTMGVWHWLLKPQWNKTKLPDTLARPEDQPLAT